MRFFHVKEQIYEQKQQDRAKNPPTAPTHKNNCGKTLYERLSKDDELNGESNSITNQESICQVHFRPKNESAPINWKLQNFIRDSPENPLIFSLYWAKQIQDTQ